MILLNNFKSLINKAFYIFIHITTSEVNYSIRLFILIQNKHFFTFTDKRSDLVSITITGFCEY